jgi:glutaminyl-tRNA synthetase
VNGGYVGGYDDPRMPTLAAYRRRGFTPEAIKEFCRRVGVAKTYNVVEPHILEDCIREDLNRTAPRVMAVLNPVKVVITNYPEGKVDFAKAVNNPEDPSAGTREVPFTRELFIEQDDFREEPPPKFFRLSPGREVRLRYACWIKCEEVVKDEEGNVVELRCTYDPDTWNKDPSDGRKVKATLHWVSAPHAIEAEVRSYDRLFLKADPDDVEEGQTYLSNLNPDSLVVTQCRIEPSVAGATAGSRYQFERQGYYCVDYDSTPERLVFNRTVTLRDSWARIEAASRPQV